LALPVGVICFYFSLATIFVLPDEANFWNEAQAAFLAEAKADDSDWCESVDMLDSLLRENNYVLFAWLSFPNISQQVTNRAAIMGPNTKPVIENQANPPKVDTITK